MHDGRENFIFEGRKDVLIRNERKFERIGRISNILIVLLDIECMEHVRKIFKIQSMKIITWKCYLRQEIRKVRYCKNALIHSIKIREFNFF